MESPAAAPDPESLARRFGPYLVFVACRRYGIPQQDVEDIWQQIVLSYCRQSRTVADVEAWMRGAVVRACAYYWRTRGRAPEAFETDPKDGQTTEVAERLLRVLGARQALRRIDERCRKGLWLRYALGLSEKEVAERLGWSVVYTNRRLVHCRRAFRAEWLRTTRGSEAIGT